jgi:serine/threonine-protein kinase
MVGVRLGSLPDSTEQERRFVQDRLALFAKVTFLITCAFLIVSSAADSLRGVGRMGTAGRTSHVIASLIALLLWLVLRSRHDFKPRTLQLVSAKHLLLGERVAIKVLTRTVSEREEALKRLQREARILARLDDEHVVRVLDLGKLENGAPFIVMEHLARRDLGSLLEEQGRFAPELAVGFVLQAAVALAAAHSSGVVHRDIKPENLFCVERGGSRLIKVLDFGVSRLEPSRPDDFLLSSVTRTNTLIGTPLYMSPEQIRNAKEVDARSDIWSLGVVLYEFLAGVPPFMGASFGDVAVKIAAESMPPLTGVAEAIDPGLAAVVMRCLEKDRAARFQSVAELGRALSPFAPGSEQLIERIEYLLSWEDVTVAVSGAALRHGSIVEVPFDVLRAVALRAAR